MTICGNDAVAQRIAPTGQNAIAQGIALGREILRNSSPEWAKFDAPPPEKFRPFRAKPFRPPITQGDVLGYRILPRWGNPARRFPQNMKRGSITPVPRISEWTHFNMSLQQRYPLEILSAASRAFTRLTSLGKRRTCA